MTSYLTTIGMGSVLPVTGTQAGGQRSVRVHSSLDTLGLGG